MPRFNSQLMTWFFTNLISAFLLPPLSLLVLAIAGLIMYRSKPRLGRSLLLGSLALLWIFSTPYFAEYALRLLEGTLKPVDAANQSADAIVVLGGGSYFKAPEYAGKDTVGAQSLVRLRYAAKLQRETGKPVLVTGGKPLGNDTSEAQQMKAILEQEFNVPVKWTEEASNNTREDALYSYKILQQAGIKHIYLVTHAWHMPRSAMVFQAAGFIVTPAPLAFTTRYKTDLLSFIPNAESLNDSRIFMHELIGLVWYRLTACKNGYLN
jgi:uncharacterized SAM-binding protein YcdF (DUF218 family)